jgi:prephenate dehydrogenase
MALEAGVIDESGSLEAGFFRDLDLLVYCTPLKATLDMLRVHGRLLGPDTLVTDVVSLKGPVLDSARKAGLQSSFVGSHPMCGGEGSGFGASRKGLFSGAKVWVVAGEATPENVESVRQFWASLGGKTVGIEAPDHDRLMAVASHLPQLTSNALGAVLARFGVRRADLGPGGRDMTRLAGSNPEMWKDLIEHAPATLSDALGAVVITLADLKRRLDTDQENKVEELMRETRAWFEEGEWS